MKANITEKILQDLYNEVQTLKKKIATNGAIVKQFYHIKELSTVTGLSVRALKGRRARGKIKMINNGNDILITVVEVKRFLKNLGLVLY